jgi:CcmD family protein
MGYLFAAYTIILIVTFAYIFFMFYRLRRLRGEIDSLKEALEAKGKDLNVPD